MRALLVIVLLIFCAASAAATEKERVIGAPAHAITQIGTQDDAGYRIDIPANWNRGLVVYFHGYSIDPVRFEKGEAISPMFEPILKSGFAVIQSAYSQTGWAVEQGGADTERLRRAFIAVHGQPKRTFVMGMSMGGTLTVMAIETTPQLYDGALSLCGAIEPTDASMQRDFALRAAFDVYFPDLLGSLVPVAADYRPTEAVVAKIGAAMQANPTAAASLRAIYGAGDSSSLPDVIAFITYDVMEMQHRTHGNPFGNADLIYTGSGDDFALNDGVRRYHADARAAADMALWYTPTGKLLKPMLALHDTGDPLVVASTAFGYALLAQRAGHGDHFVQQYVNAQGHCVFTPAQIGHAFDELVDWSRGGKRPESGLLR
jgi:pimeloyl-ACP methyl ester carboxylesterase